MLLVLRLEPFEDENRFLDGGRFDLDSLEPAFERGVLLDVFAMLVQGRSADALEFAAAEGGFDDVRSVQGAFGGTRANDGMEFVDEENDVLGTANLVHNRFDALFELAAVFGAGDHQGEVQRDDALIAEKLWHVAGGDFLG